VCICRHNAAVRDRYREWIAALAVLALTVVAVALDLTDRSIRRFWILHSFTSSVVAGLLVLLLTVLVVDRVHRGRVLKNQSRAIGAQAAVIVAQAGRAADAIKRPSPTDDDREQASQELRTYLQMLLTSAPVLIDARASRAFLETAQKTAARLYDAQRATADDVRQDLNAHVDDALERLHQAAAPLLAPLNLEQRAAASDVGDADGR
jgi:hypothetical protein